MNIAVKLRKGFQKNKSYFILLLLPLGFTFLFGGVMSPILVSDIPIGIYDLDRSSFSKTVIDQFYDCPAFEVKMDYDSMQQVEEEILTNKIRGCVVIPEGFGQAVRGKKGAEALVLIDQTNFLIGNNIQLFATTIFSNVNASIQMQTLEAAGMVPYQAEQSVYTLNVADRTLYNPQLGYFYYLYAGLLAVFVQQTFLAVTVPVLLTEKLRLKKLPEDPRIRKVQGARMGKLIVKYGLLSMIGMLACLLAAHYVFNYPLLGNLPLTLLIHVIFIACLVGVAFVVASIFDDVTHGVQFVMFFTIPTLLSCGYAWPEYMMAPGFAAVVKAVWPLYYYANPLKDLMVKGVGFDVISHYVIGGMIFALVWIPVGGFLYRHKIRAIKKIEKEGEIQTL